MSLFDSFRSASPRSHVGLLAVAVVAAPLGAGFLGRIHPALDSFSHFRVYLALLLMVVALPLFATRFLKVGALAVFAGLAAIASTSGNVPLPALGMGYGPLYPASLEQPVYTLMQLNLRFDNQEKERVLSLIGRIRPDVVTLNEVSDAWAEKLDLIKGAYPYSIRCPFAREVWGVAILSRRPFSAGTPPNCDTRGAFAVASIDFGGRAVEVASLHLGWPWPFDQSWQINGVSPYLDKLGPTTILAGDMNSVPWSESVSRVARAGHLTLMPSDGPTFLPRQLPEALRFAGLPIDQVFATQEILVHGISRLEAVGSDHLPVLVQFSLRADRKPKGSGETATALLGLVMQPRG